MRAIPRKTVFACIVACILHACGGDNENQAPPPKISDIEGDGTQAGIVDTGGVLDGVRDRVDAEHRFRDAWIVTGEHLDTIEECRLEGIGNGAPSFTDDDGLRFEEGGSDMRRNLLLPATLVAGLYTLTITGPGGQASAQVYVLQGEKGEPGDIGPPGTAGTDGLPGHSSMIRVLDETAGANCPAGGKKIETGIDEDGDGVLDTSEVDTTGYICHGQEGPQGDSMLDCIGGTCTLDQSLAVNGDIVASNLSVTTSYDLPPCPEGYVQDQAETRFVLCERGTDQVVRVGNFWIDRYEASTWTNQDCSGEQYGDTDDWGAVAGIFPQNGNWSVPIYACSVPGVTPSSYITWFQAQAACSLSGKYLCSNEEWQAAAEGTVDPGPWPDANDADGCTGLTQAGACNTCSDGPRQTGQGTGCVSNWGAEDMAGNLWEWTASWHSAGMSWQSSDGQINTTAWPDGYGNDATWNVNGRSHDGSSYMDGLPAAALRGGPWSRGQGSGTFAMDLDLGPSSWFSTTGFRCCQRR